MDPFSIAVGSASLAQLCGQCVYLLTKWIGEVKAIDKTISGFCGEIETLKSALESLEAATKTSSMQAVAKAAETSDSNVLWIQMDKSISDTKKVLVELESILNRLRSTQKSIFRKPIKQFKASLESGEISTLRQRIVLLNTTLNLPLQMLSVYMQAEKSISDNSSDKEMIDKIDSLQKTVSSLQSIIRARRDSRNHQAPNSDDQDILTHVSELVQTAEGFASNASAISSIGSVAGPATGAGLPQVDLTPSESADPERGLIRNLVQREKDVPSVADSVFGESMPVEKQAIIGRWIPEPSRDDSNHLMPGTERSRSVSLSSRSSTPMTTPSSFPQSEEFGDSDDDDDLEVQLLSKRLARGRLCFDGGRYSEAEPILKKALRTMGEPRFTSRIAFSVEDVNLMLATIYLKLDKLEKAEALLLPLATITSEASQVDRFSAQHLLAEIWEKQGSFECAADICLDATKGRRKALGKTNALYIESARLLIQIYYKLGDAAEAELWEDLLPLQRSTQVENFVNCSNEIDDLCSRGEVEKAADLGVKLLKDYTVNTFWLWTSEKGESWLKWDEIRKNIIESRGVGLAASGHGFTPLHYLAASTPECDGEVQFLLECGADINATWTIRHQKSGPWAGCTPLMMAVLWGKEKVFRVLLKNGGNIHAKDAGKRDLLSYAASNGNIAIVGQLLDLGLDIESRAEFGNTALHYSAISGRYDTIELLLTRGANVGARQNNGEIALHKCASHGKYDCAKLLLSKGADIETKDNEGLTPLHHASKCGWTKVVELLVERGANLLAESKQNWNALIFAARWGHAATIRFLLMRASETNRPLLVMKNMYGWSAIHFAARHGHETAFTALWDHAPESNSALIDDCTTIGATALHLAVYGGHEPIVKSLCAEGASVMTENNSNQTPIYHAIKAGRADIAKLLLDSPRGMDTAWLDARRHGGMNPLHIAADDGHAAIILLLLQAGVSIDARDTAHLTALAHARRENHPGVVELLLAKGAEDIQCHCQDCKEKEKKEKG